MAGRTPETHPRLAYDVAVRAVLFAADPTRGGAFLGVLAAEGYDAELRVPESDRVFDRSAPPGCAIVFLDLALGLDRVGELCRGVLAPAVPVPPLIAVLGEPGPAAAEALVAAGVNLNIADDLPAIARRARFLHGGLRNRLEESALLRRLSESEERHRALIDTLAEGVVIRGRDGSFVTINPAAARLLGLTSDEVAARAIPDGAFDFLDEDERPLSRTPELSDQVRAAGQTVHHEEVGIRRRDGSVAWAEVFAHPLCDPATGEQLAVVATLTDRTQRRRVRAQLFELLEGLPDAALIHEHQRVLWVNQRLCTLLGYADRAELVGRDALEFVPERFQESLRARIEARAERRERPP
jgi:PAS domain S-box-containing protein